MSRSFESILASVVIPSAVLSLGVSACIGRRQPPEAPQHPIHLDAGRADSLTREARSLLQQGHAEAALKRLLLAQSLVPPNSRRLAELLELEGEARVDAEDDAAPPFRQALHIWEKLEGEHGIDVARVAIDLGHAEVLNHEWELGEKLFQRSLDIRERIYGPIAEPLASPLLGLLRVNLQLCRVERAEALANRLMTIARAVPTAGRDPELYPNVQNALAGVAQLRGDTAAAIAAIGAGLEAPGIPAASVPWRRYHVLGMMAEIAEFAGDFSTVVAARKEKLGVIESNSTSTFFERWSSVFELHFAYAAADNQQMLDAHDTKYVITSATVGEIWPKAVFPLPGLCDRPLSYAELDERVELTEQTTETIKTCRDGVQELSNGKPVAMVVWMRSDASGRVQAASAAGVGYSETVLRCAAYAAVGRPWHFPVPRGFDYVFIRP